MFIKKWKEVLGSNGKYYASNTGQIISTTIRVNSNWGHRIKKGRLLHHSPNHKGYRKLILSIDGNPTTYYVHRLVWEAFNGKIPDGMQINHINEIKDDNRLSNLSLATAKENANWGTRNARVAEKITHSLSDAQAVLGTKFNKNINIIEYGGANSIGTFKCNTCGDVFKRVYREERKRKGNGCGNCGRLDELSKNFEKVKIKLNDRFNGNIVFTDTQYAGSHELSNFKCLACGAEFTKTYHAESKLNGNGHPRCPNK